MPCITYVTVKTVNYYKFALNIKKKISLFFLIPQIKMVERPKLAAVCGHYNYYYAQLDLLRKRAHEPSYHCVPQKDTGVEENYSQEESHRPSPRQW